MHKKVKRKSLEGDYQTGNYLLSKDKITNKKLNIKKNLLLKLRNNQYTHSAISDSTGSKGNRLNTFCCCIFLILLLDSLKNFYFFVPCILFKAFHLHILGML